MKLKVITENLPQLSKCSADLFDKSGGVIVTDKRGNNVNRINECVTNLYIKNGYIDKNPSLHRENSPWKVSKIIPFVDAVIDRINKKEINVLDVGGGAGTILSAVSSHIEKKCGIKVNKYALDLNPYQHCNTKTNRIFCVIPMQTFKNL